MLINITMGAPAKVQPEPVLPLRELYAKCSLIFIVVRPRLGLATYSLFALWLCLFVVLSVSRLTQKRHALCF